MLFYCSWNKNKESNITWPLPFFPVSYQHSVYLACGRLILLLAFYFFECILPATTGPLHILLTLSGMLFSLSSPPFTLSSKIFIFSRKNILDFYLPKLDQSLSCYTFSCHLVLFIQSVIIVCDNNLDVIIWWMTLLLILNSRMARSMPIWLTIRSMACDTLPCTYWKLKEHLWYQGKVLHVHPFFVFPSLIPLFRPFLCRWLKHDLVSWTQLLPFQI